MIKIKYMAILLLFATFTLPACGSSGGDGDTTPVTPSSVTLNPALDFYINRSWDTDTNVLWGYGIDDIGSGTYETTGSEYGNSGGRNYHNFFKVLFNFNISSLNGANIESAYFRIYLYGISGTDTPKNAILENIFYGDTDSFPYPRNYGNEFDGYIVSPVISGSEAATTVGWIQFDVTTKLQSDIDDGRSNSQFRLSHEDAGNWTLQYFCDWYMTDNTFDEPELVITYTP
jgi:hypothetical protein